MKTQAKENIKIKTVLKANGTPRFVEFISIKDEKTVVMEAHRFCETFGFMMGDLGKMKDAE